MARTQTNGSSQKNTPDLEAQIATLKSDVAALTDTLSDYGSTQTAHLSEAAADTFNSAKKAGAETAEQVKQQARNAYAGAEKTVRANPASSVGIAAGVGFLVGILASRR